MKPGTEDHRGRAETDVEATKANPERPLQTQNFYSYTKANNRSPGYMPLL